MPGGVRGGGREAPLYSIISVPIFSRHLRINTPRVLGQPSVDSHKKLAFPFSLVYEFILGGTKDRSVPPGFSADFENDFARSSFGGIVLLSDPDISYPV